MTRGSVLWAAIACTVVAMSMACGTCPDWVPPLATTYMIVDADAEELLGGTLEVSERHPITGFQTFVFTYVRDGDLVEVTYFQPFY